MANQPPLFSRLFGPSPIQPIQEHMETCADCVEKLAPYMNAVMTADWSEASSLYNEISELENKADDLKKQIRLGLPRSLFLPVSRTNLLDLVHTQDKIANSAQDVAGRIIGRQLEIPDQIKTEFLAYLDTSLETVRLARRTMSEVSDLINSGFSQQGVETIEEILYRTGIIDVGVLPIIKRVVGVLKRVFSLGGRPQLPVLKRVSSLPGRPQIPEFFEFLCLA